MDNRYQGSRPKYSKKTRIGPYIILCVMLMAATAVLTYKLALGDIDTRNRLDEAKVYAEIEKAVTENYIGEVDSDALHGAACAAMVRALGDKWSYYMSAEEYEAYKLSSVNEYAGVGINLVLNDAGEYEISSVLVGSAAEAAGIIAGTTLVSVNSQPVKGMELTAVQELIRGLQNANFSVVVADEKGDESSVFINCAESYSSPVSSRLMDGSVGYVRIRNFEAGSGDDAIKAIEGLIELGATSFVFDLRDDPGGLLEEMAKVLDYILPDGKLYSSVDKNGEATSVTSDKLCLKYKIAVIVNENSYSAAEFFAADIQEYNWGLVVGTQTSGKSRSQINVELENGGAIHISAGKYLTSKDVDLASVGGVTPNVSSVQDPETPEDEQLDAAVRAIRSMS